MARMSLISYQCSLVHQETEHSDESCNGYITLLRLGDREFWCQYDTKEVLASIFDTVYFT